MKFFIDDVEIKTVLNGAKIQGGLNSVSRCASFSYVYTNDIQETMQYKAKIGYEVVIKNDKNECIFKGKISQIEYYQHKNIINIKARDLFSEILLEKIKGRFKGSAITVLNKFKCKFSFLEAVLNFLKKEVNIVSLGKLSTYDVIKIIFKETVGAEFKLYVDGNSRINILLPFFDKSVHTFILQEDIISAYFACDKKHNTSRIKLLNKDDVVSGSIIEIKDPINGIKERFVVESDIHTYDEISTMELCIKERGVSIN